jgi:NitT/TauT family transport system substrate-binding protein
MHRSDLLRGAASVLAAAALLVGGASTTAAQSPTVVKVATTPLDSGAEVYYAQELGLFKKAGLEVQITSLSNGSAVAAGVASGAIDIAQGSIPSLAAAHDRGVPFVLVAPGALYSSKSPTSALVVAKNSPIRTARDLAGRTLANNGLKNIGEVAADAWIAQNGGDASALRVIEMPMPQMQDALSSGRIDAAIIVEPELSKALHADARLLAPAYSAIASDFMIGAYFSTSDWAKQHPELVKKFDAAIREAGQWANNPANHARSAQILAQYTKIAVTPATTRAHYADRLNPALIQPVLDASAKYHALDHTFPAAELIADGMR